MRVLSLGPFVKGALVSGSTGCGLCRSQKLAMKINTRNGATKRFTVSHPKSCCAAPELNEVKIERNQTGITARKFIRQ